MRILTLFLLLIFNSLMLASESGCREKLIDYRLNSERIGVMKDDLKQLEQDDGSISERMILKDLIQNLEITLIEISEEINFECFPKS